MVTNLSLGSRRQLDAQGFQLNHRIGFDTQKIPLYTHKKLIGKQVGAVLTYFTLVSPHQLNEGEAAYLQRKAHQGIFPWKPGADCLRREMKDIELSKNQLTGAVTSKVTESRKGCPWCRETQESQGETEALIVPVENEPSTTVSGTSSPVTACDQCDYVGKGKTPGIQSRSVLAHKRANH